VSIQSAAPRTVIVLGDPGPELRALLGSIGLTVADESPDGVSLWMANHPIRHAQRAVASTTPPPVRDLLTITEAASRLGIGRSTAYQLIGSGQLPVVRLGRAARVPAQAISELVDRLMTQQGQTFTRRGERPTEPGVGDC
jgi:excisionase family DNA binding protein